MTKVMSNGDEQTFSIEVLSFSSGTDDEGLVASIEDAFGMDADGAKTLIQQAPVRVKRGADPEGTKLLVSQLLALKADVRITNEQTGEERVYQAAALGSAAASQPPPAGPSATAPSAQSSPIPSAEGGYRPEAGTSLLEALKAARKKQFQTGGNPIAPSQTGGQAVFRPSPSGMLPDDHRATPNPLRLNVPPSQPPPPHEGPVLESCSVCNRKVTQGDICNHCGWSNSLKKRLSPSGKEPLPQTKVGAIPVVILAVAGLAGAGAGYWFLGPFEALAGPAIAAALSLILAGVSVQLRSQTWSVPETYLKADEKKRLGRSRAKWYTYGATFIGIAGAAFVPGALEPPAEIRVDSFGVGWAVELPGSAPEPERKAIRVDAFGASVQATGMLGRPDRSEPHSYGMIRVPVGLAASSSAETIDQAAKAVLEKLFTDVKVGEAKDASFEGAQKGRAGTFEGRDESRVASGEWRAFLFPNELLVVLYAGEGGASPKGQAVLDAVQTVKPGAP